MNSNINLGHITDMDIQALVDNQLSGFDKLRVLEHIELNEMARLRYEALIEQKALLRRWWITQQNA